MPEKPDMRALSTQVFRGLVKSLRANIGTQTATRDEINAALVKAVNDFQAEWEQRIRSFRESPSTIDRKLALIVTVGDFDMALRASGQPGGQPASGRVPGLEWKAVEPGSNEVPAALAGKLAGQPIQEPWSRRNYRFTEKACSSGTYGPQPAPRITRMRTRSSLW